MKSSTMTTPLVLWMAIIFIFSTNLGSIDHTNSLFIPIITFFVPNISDRHLRMILVLIRKLGHMAEYAILSALWFLRLNQGKHRGRVRPILWAIGLSILYATTDEAHQFFVSSRTASVIDIGFDAMGAMLAPTVCNLFETKSFSVIQRKFFGWWFTWGVFSAIMVLIVLQGGGLALWKIVFLVILSGLLAGTAGVIYSIRNVSHR